jgi:hypothetical protein
MAVDSVNFEELSVREQNAKAEHKSTTAPTDTEDPLTTQEHSALLQDASTFDKLICVNGTGTR